MSQPTRSSNSTNPANDQTVYPTPNEDRLTFYCQRVGYRAPQFQVLSDRRGGRTAWSCEVIINGSRVPARFWYDGSYVHNAKEDAAQVALERLGLVPPRGVQPSDRLHNHNQPNQPNPQSPQNPPTPNGQRQEQRFHGAIHG